MAEFIYAPEEKSVYKVQEDCCYTRVVFGGEQVGVSAKNDQAEDYLNSWNLLCYTCDDTKNYQPSTEEFYLEKLSLVNALRSARPE